MFRRWLSALLAVVVFCASIAVEASPLGGGPLQPAARRLIQPSFAPVAYADLATSTAIPSGLTHSRPGLAMMEDRATGNLTYAPNNLVLNSATLNTQTVTVQAGVSYLLTTSGAGSVTLSGAATGTLAGGGDLKVTAATASLTLTVSGSVTNGILSAVTYETTRARRIAAGINDNPAPTGAAAYYGPRLTSKGLLIEEARTNIFRNTDAPATHSVTVAAQAYTLSFYGTGSITLSGAYSGTLNGPGAWPQAAPAKLTFSPTAGTLTITVSGQVQYPNLEAGGFATSHIPNGAATTTRPADVVQIVGPALAALQGAQGSAIIESAYASASISANATLIGTPTSQLMMRNIGGTLAGWNGVATLNDGSASWVTPQRGAAVWSAAGRGLVLTGSSITVDANIVGNAGAHYLGSMGNGAFWNGSISKLAIYKQRLPDAILQAKTVLGAPLQ